MASIQHLLGACEDGNPDLVRSILDKGVDVNAFDDTGTTALQVAAANGAEDIVRLLLMRGAALDQTNNLGWTAMMHAARYGHKNVVALLIQSNADINARNSLGASAITHAARGGHLQICKLLVESGIDLSPSTGIGESSCEVTPLMAAALHGHDTIVRYLLDRGFDVNYRTPSMGINALMLAALNGHMATAQILIERGADPNHTNVNDHTPLEISSIRGKREVNSYLDRKTTNKPKIAPEDIKPDIIEAAKAGDFQRMKEILDEDITQCDAVSPQDGATPLMFAAMTGRLDLVQLLVESRCEINKQDTVSGWTALMQAVYHGKKPVARYLVNAGADVLIAAKNGCTAFDMASLIDEVDTELYRLLATKTLQVSRPEKGKKSWTLKPGSPDNGFEKPPDRSALKAWWGRMSNRFRNLKLGSTFKLASNRLAPLHEPGDKAATISNSPRGGSNDLKKSVSVDQIMTSGVKDGRSEETSTMSAGTSTSVLDNVGTSLLDNPGMSILDREASNTSPMLDTGASNISIKSYETMMLETHKNATTYSLQGVTPVYQTNSIADSTLKPGNPSFMTPQNFDTDRPKMPPVNTRKSTTNNIDGGSSTVTSHTVQPMKFLRSYSSNQNLHLSSTSQNAGVAFKYSDRSPSSSGGASGTTTISKGKSSSSATSSTLTAGSDLNSSGHKFMTPGRAWGIPNRTVTFSRHRPHRISPNSSTSSGSSLSVPRSYGKKTSSRDTCSSSTTLTPAPSPKQPAGLSTASSSTSGTIIKAAPDEYELGGLLKNLSLERYQPIFEEQEVDMEAFLTLTDTDLEELGISQTEPRRQILVAITELNSGKGRERQQLHDTMSTFRSTVPAKHRYSSDSGSISLSKWDLAEESQQLGASHKSRSS